MNPHKLLLFYLIPAYLLVVTVPILFGPGAVVVRFRHYLDARSVGLGLLFLGMVWVWSYAAIALRLRGGRATEPYTISPYLLDFLALATIGAYLVWFHRILLNPISLYSLLSGGLGAVVQSRGQNPTVPGVTTATQLGVAYAVVYLYQLWGAKQEFSSRRFAFYLYAILTLSVFRVFVWAERLAFIELMIPIAVLFAIYRANPRRVAYRVLLMLWPLLAVLVVIGFFALTEFLRSWSSFYQYQGKGFGEFILTRFISYYYTALNNGAGMLVILDWPVYDGRFVAEWLHRFPLLLGAIFRFLVVETGQSDFLERFADPEFNNPSGIFAIFFDVGIGVGLLYASCLGLLLGLWYNELKTGVGLGALMFPACYIGLLEILRLPYFGMSRSFPFFVALLVAYALFRRKGKAGSRSASLRRVSGQVLIETKPWWQRLRARV